ncbi:MAG: M20 metallopeptidase family protein [Planctomycetota bacterium]|jgi:amidohydrolase
MNEALAGRLDPILERIREDVKAYREHIHEHPELSLQEKETTAFIETHLKAWGYSPFRPPGLETGAVALLEGKGSEGPVVALRADIDALPITEETGAVYASKARAVFQGETVGVMHACGHDGHTAILLGVARALKEMEGEVPGKVKFIFQPGEEGGGGGRLMAEGGVLKDPPVQAIFALHGRPWLPLGMIELAETPNASTDAFEIDVIGKGGHGAYPQTTRDPIPVAAQIINGLQTIVSRKVRPDQPAVVTVGAVQAGTTFNVIPDRAHLKGTVRTLDPQIRSLTLEALRTVAEHTAAASGLQARVHIHDGYPPVRCDRALIEHVRRTAVRLFGPDLVRDQLEQTLGGEDFAYYLEDQGGVPGVIFRLGVGCDENQHTSRFDFGDRALLPGTRILAHVALDFLLGERG